MISYRMATEDERPVVEQMIRECVGDISLPHPEISEIAIAVDGDKAVGACYLTQLVRVGPFCVLPEYRGKKVSFSKLVKTINARIGDSVPYFTFQPDRSREDKMIELGYTPTPWTVYLKE